MEMSGEYRIPANREKVWAALNDVEILKACIPGCESLDKTSENEMTAKVRMRVGPVSAAFSGKVTLSEIDPPNGYRISGEGQGGPAGFAKGGATVALKEEGADTVLTYKADAQVGGKIAQVGARLIDGTAKKLADEFFGKFTEVVGAAAQPAASVAAGPVVAAPATESAARGMRHWMIIGGVIAVLLIVYFASR
jgi:carbon monoxide dehydrogenase subunit G